MIHRDVTTGNFLVRPLQWWAESALPGSNRVKVPENLGSTAVAPAAPVDTSLIQEKLEKSLAFKDEGNNLYKAKEYKKAMRKYHNAILYLKGINNDLHGSSVDPNSEKKITEEMEQECIKASISVYNNLAACILATVKENSTSNAEKEHEKVVQYTDIVLELDEENDKALYRKAQALKLLRDISGAQETFEKLKSAKAKKGQNVPKDVTTGIKDCQEALKDYDKKEKSMYQNMFTN